MGICGNNQSPYLTNPPKPLSLLSSVAPHNFSKYGLVTFTGAGPGDPELLTLAGKKVIETADLVLYAGYFIAPEIIAFAKPEAIVLDAAELGIEQGHALIREVSYAGGSIAHIHAGDPSMYGPLAEQIALLEQDNIPWKVIPGITAAFAGAARCGLSFSMPDGCQSLIITRMEGNKPLPPNEDLSALAANYTAMAIYLGGHKCGEVQSRLERSLPTATTVICASRIGWPEEQVLWTTLGELGKCGAEHNLGRQTVIFVLPQASPVPFTGSKG